MPNSYSVFPNVLPGNVTIGGNLTLLGDQLQLGSGTPKVRLFNVPNTALVLSYNLGFDVNTQDDAAGNSFAYEAFTSNNRLQERWKAPAGTIQQGAFPLPIFTDYTQHVHTGTVTLDTIVSKVIRGGIIGANGGLRLRIVVRPTVQGAPAGAVGIRLGGTQMAFAVISNTDMLLLQHTITNRNAQNVNFTAGYTVDFVTGAGSGGGGVQSAVDTSVDQTLAITLQSGTATDSQTLEMVEVELINSFGPV